MKTEYIISKNEAYIALNNIANKITKTHNKKIDIVFDSHEINSRININTAIKPSALLPMQIIIGTHDLTNNRQNNYVNSKDLVNTIQSIFHEERHAHQHIALYSDINASQNIIDMAQIQTICKSIPEYNQMIYFRNPSEIDAEIYSFNKTIDYFNLHFLNTDNTPKINAKQEILNSIHDKYDNNYGWFGDTSSKTYNDAINSLNKNKTYYKNHIINFLDYDYPKPSKKYQNLISNKEFITKYINCQSPQEAIDLLYIDVINHHQEHTNHYACMKNMVKQMKTKKLTKSRYGIAMDTFSSIFKSKSNDELEK